MNQNQTTNNRTQRQESLDLRMPTSVTIVGCGGVGSWVAMFLALAGVPRLILWDLDTISDHNLNRLPLDPGTIGENKAIAMRLMLARLVPQCEVVSMYRWTADAAAKLMGEAGHELHWIVATTDTHSSRRDIRQFSEEHDCSYIEGSAEGEFGGCSGEPATFTTADEINPGYASVPVHVGPCVMSAAMICYHILHGALPGDFAHRIGWNTDHHCMETQDFPRIVLGSSPRAAEIA